MAGKLVSFLDMLVSGRVDCLFDRDSHFTEDFIYFLHSHGNVVISPHRKISQIIQKLVDLCSCFQFQLP